MKPVIVRGVRIGEGMPKIIAPIVGRTREEILKEAAAICASGAEPDAACAMAAGLRAALGEIPLLCTFRTRNEGGAQAIAPESYAVLLRQICECGAADMIDVEAFSAADAAQLIADARSCGICTVASNHDFSATPAEDELVRRLEYMAQIGADIPKIAVMPADNGDVLTLLRATARAATTTGRPLITMSMGALGAVSRISGECFGSACTFGSVGAASAPGQIPVAQLRAALEMLRQN